MENIKIIFGGSENTSDQEMQVYHNTSNEIFIKIYDWQTPEHAEIITLNKANAVKLCKVLKREISKIES
tara:strand:- start:460 stop:666 length:207 start_codon:yes stop_codon:yes gene_type:complete